MQNKVNILFSEVIKKGINFTTKDLKEWGFNRRDINKLIESGIIMRVKKGSYTLIDVNKLHFYGKRFLKRNRNFAYKTFERCAEIDPNHGGVIFDFFFRDILNKNYESALNYLKKLFNDSSDIYKKDYNCYLFLISFLIKLPENLQSMVDTMKEEDLLVDSSDTRYANIDEINKIRKKVYNGKWFYAFSSLNVLPKKQMVDIAMCCMLYDIFKIFENNLCELWQKGNYQEFINLLELKQDRFVLTKIEYFQLMLARKFVNMIRTKEIPDSMDLKDGTVYDYINANDFFKAFEIINSQDSKSVMFKLLGNIIATICDLIEKIKNEKKPDLFTLLFMALLNYDMILAEKYLSEYLEGIGKSFYYPIILNHIKLCYMDNDFTFIKPMSLLAQVKNNTINLDLDYYQKIFKYYVSCNNVEAVALVKQIIRLLGGHVDIIQEPKEISTNSQEKMIEPANDSKKIKTFSSFYLTVKYEELMQDKGLVLLDPMTFEERQKIMIELNDALDVTCFTIGEDEPKRLVLQYTPKRTKYIDAKGILANLNNKYNAKNYQEVISDCLEVLKLRKVKSFTCYKIGFAYAHLRLYQKAKDYLLIASELSKTDRSKPYDFTDIIKRFEESSYRRGNDVKSFVDVSLEEFLERDEDSELEYFKNAVLYNGEDFFEVCKCRKLDNDETGRILLLLARECYVNNNINSGNNFIKLFEKMPQKSRCNLILAEEVKKNKTLYINRGCELVRSKN